MTTFLQTFQLSNNLFSLWITAIYSSASARKWIIFHVLLIVGVSFSVMVGSDYGGMDSLFQVTTRGDPFWEVSIEGKDSTSTIEALNAPGSKGNDFFLCSINEPLMFYNIQESKTLISTLLAGQAGIYMILNRINGTYYIGSSVNLADRMKRHINGSSSNAHLQGAFKKYGISNFSLIILDICAPIKAVLLSLEQLAFDLYKPAYNFLDVAGSSLGMHHTAEAKAKISEAMTGKPRSLETRSAMSARQAGTNNSFYGKTHTEENKAHLSSIAKARLELPRANTVEVLNIETLEVTRYRSIREAARALKSDTRSISKRLNNGTLFRNLYKFSTP